MKKILVNERGFLGTVAEWAVKQSPYHRPDNLEVVLDKLHEQTKSAWKDAELGFIGFPNESGLLQFVHENLSGIPEYLEWNERKNGNNAPYGFTGRNINIDPDNDFIDLDALERNVVTSIINESKSWN